MPDHDVVVQLNFESLAGCFQFARHLDVGPGRLGIATGMIVHRDERSGVEDQGTLQDLARVNGRVIDGAALLHLVGDEIVLAVKEQDSKLFDLLVGHCSLQVGDQRLPIAEHRAASHFGSGHATCDFPHQAEDGDVVSG